ncbi:ABC transporter permease [Jannaschia sp. KMU-145]|uniref:ABC transporter permease n=1 Tax=Jannaschia halovivens TaxID=3388667 RepID=UPI00396AF621
MAEPVSPPALRDLGGGRRWGSARTIGALILREMTTSYGRSPGGYLWAVIEPVAAIAVLTGLFALAFQAPRLGTNFPIFYATGVIPFLMFTDLAGKTAAALTFSKALLAYPSVTFADAIIARFALNLATQVMVAAIVLAGILWAFDTRTAPDLGLIVLALAMVAVCALGVGVVNCLLFTLLPVWQRVWSIATRPLFLLSGVLFVFDDVPAPYDDWLWWNPLIHAVGVMRRAFYFNYAGEYVSVAYVVGLGMGLTVTGLLFLRRYHRVLLNR